MFSEIIDTDKGLLGNILYEMTLRANMDDMLEEKCPILKLSAMRIGCDEIRNSKNDPFGMHSCRQCILGAYRTDGKIEHLKALRQFANLRLV